MPPFTSDRPPPFPRQDREVTTGWPNEGWQHVNICLLLLEHNGFMWALSLVLFRLHRWFLCGHYWVATMDCII